MPWLIAQNAAPEKVLSQHGWTKNRPVALEFRAEGEAQAYIDEQRVAGHPIQLTSEEKIGWETRGTVQTDYDPYGLNR